MNRKLRHVIISAMVFLTSFALKSQSTIEYQTGTQIEVTAGADICADNVLINGTYSGGGTKCNGPLPVEIISFTVLSRRLDAELKWSTATEENNYGFEIERRVEDGLQTITPLYPPSRGDRGVTWAKIGFVE